ncbi:MAG: adenylosuccinate lyase [Saprospiraceae bacterium]|nr:adenylosuccinate lyase [Saprospiraceae bacterium]
MITAISPVDGRYSHLTRPLTGYFSEYALIRNRVLVEIEYFKALVALGLPQLADAKHHLQILDSILLEFNEADAGHIKQIEKITNHDVKAVEYFLKEKIKSTVLEPFSEFIHFGLTSQDINNTAQPLALFKATQEVFLPKITEVIATIDQKANRWKSISMLAHTHGQPASPTSLGKEFRVFSERLRGQSALLKQIPITAKFGGATGNFNAHVVAYPEINWPDFGDHFVAQFGLQRIRWTTQIEPYDFLAAYCHGVSRINTILIDFCRDCWMYISMRYLKQSTIQTETGSSAMPHKVNPIDFENAEGNLGLSNALFAHLADKLPISRLQRDLTDSTVLRNLGVPIAHSLIAYQSLLKGLDKIEPDLQFLQNALNENWSVVAEAIQTILRREGVPGAFELLKDLTRGNKEIKESDIKDFISKLPVPPSIKDELNQITPSNYTGDINF